MSKSTVVSTLPIRISERKPGLVPSYYEVEPVTKRGEIATLTVEDGFHLVLIPLSDEKAPPMKVPDTSETIARSIVEDYISANLGVDYNPREDGAIAIPGIFWLPEDCSADVVKVKHAKKVQQALKNTIAWFERLILMADGDWTKNRAPRMITDTQRAAARFLGISREWNFSAFEASTVLCWACKTAVNTEAMICSNCKAILNKELYEKSKGQFANV